MKRSLNILLISLLSLLVVFLSVGTTFMHCLRYNTVSIGVVGMMKSDCCAKEKCEDKQWKSHCMEHQQVKLSPMLSVQKVNFEIVPVFTGIQLGAWLLLPRPVICGIKKVGYWNNNVPHSPPRAYLNMLNTLII